MSKQRWFGAVGAAGSDPLLFSLFRLLAGTAEPAARSAATRPASADSADASWTASLSRGDDLPPCRLSILIAAGAASAVRLGPFSRDPAVRPALDR